MAILQCSKGTTEVNSVFTNGTHRNNVFEKSIVDVESSVVLGESSWRHEIRSGELIESRNGLSEEIYGDEQCHSVAIETLENWPSCSSPGDTKSCTVNYVRIGSFGDLEKEERENSESRHENLQVHPNELVHFTNVIRPRNLENVVGKAGKRLVTRTLSGEGENTDQIVSNLLSKQLKDLDVKESDSEAELGQESVEPIVEKVEGEVEFKQVTDEMWLGMRADDESHEVDRKERGFEMERREEQLEGGIGMLQGESGQSDDDLRLNHVEKDFGLQKKQNDMDNNMQNMPGSMQFSEEGPEAAAVPCTSVPNDSEMIVATSNQQTAASPQKANFLAFEDRVQEADEQVKEEECFIQPILQVKGNIYNVVQEEQHESREKELHLESSLLSTNEEVTRISGLLTEAELALSIEQERRKESLLEVDQLLENLNEENSIRGEYEEKVTMLSSFLINMKEELTIDGEDGEEVVASRLASVSKDLDKELENMSFKKLSTRSLLSENEQGIRWKLQRDTPVTRKDNLELKLHMQLRKAREREAQVEAMWVERERNLVTKCSYLEAAIVQWESKYEKRDIEALQERKLLEIELEAHRTKWADEKLRLEAVVLKQQQWLEEKVSKWTSLLDAKDRELNSLKNELEELETSLKIVKQALESPPQQVHDQQKHMLETFWQSNTSCESYKAGRSSEESDGESCQSIETFVHATDAVVDEHHKETDSGMVFVEKLILERKELEGKVSNSQMSMDEMRTVFQDKLNQSDAEMKNLEAGLSSKTAEVEDLVAQLNARERQLEALMQKFRDEVLSIDREVEKERHETRDVMEMHFVGERRLVAEIREKEEGWQNDLEAITQELFESREWARQKDVDIINLKEDFEALDEQRKDEEQRLFNRIHSLLEEKDALTDALKQEQKARVAAEAEYQRLEEEHVILLKELGAERRRNSAEPKHGGIDCQDDFDSQAADFRVVNVDIQIEEAMNEIESLREELDNKETQLKHAKKVKEIEWERRQAALIEEYEDMLDMREQELQQVWMRKEQELLSANDKILHQLADQRGETAIVQGALRELEWFIKHGDTNIKAKLADISKKEGMVKVHTSHLEEVDLYIQELQAKLEESEKKRKSAEIAASVRELKRVASFDVALVQGDKDRLLPNIVRHDAHPTSQLSMESGMESLRIRTRFSLGDTFGRSFNSPREIQPDPYLEVENSSGAGRYGGNIGSSTSYGQPRYDYSLPVLPPPSPGRRQQKWFVDVSWLENARKEQTILRNQLDFERQQICSFGQVEAYNRMIEAAGLRALEEKHENESKILALQQEVRWSQPNPLFFCTPGLHAITSCSSPRGPSTKDLSSHNSVFPKLSGEL